jgi:hypothetical protein
MRLKILAAVIGCSVALISCTALVSAQERSPVPVTPLSDATPPASEPMPSAGAPQSQVGSEVIVLGKPLPQSDPELEKKKNWLDRYLPYEKRVAGWVDNTARSLDSFFGSDDAWRVDNDSFLRVTNDLEWEQDEGMSNDFRPRLKIDLPTASERLHLLVESDDSPEERTAAQEALPGSRSADEKRAKRTTVLGLGTNFDGWLPQWKKQLQGGLRVALPLDPYVRFIARRNLPLSGEWELNSYNRLAWFNSDGYSANSEIKIGEPIAPDWRLFYTTDLTWREKRDYLEFAQSGNLAHILSPKSAITYTLGFSGKGFEGPSIDKYFLSADYRRNIARRIVYFDVIPELSLPESYGFDPHWAITFRLELYFQKQIENND